MKIHPQPEVNQAPSRLIIGSGSTVLEKYPNARPVMSGDITVNLTDDLKPTHVLDISNLAKLKFLTKEYSGAFTEIIFERVGCGFASLYKSRRKLRKGLKKIAAMLKPEGKLIYEGFCTYSKRNIDSSLGITDNPAWAIRRVFANALRLENRLDCFHKSTKFQIMTNTPIQLQLEVISQFYTEKLGKAGLEINECCMKLYPSENDKSYLDHTYHFTLSATKSAS
ncbi:MAG: hypothetical protein VXW87_04070 [Pseudomonadota bacterium]|nr:hypothetical protein [Pseudomonadota bacterium]